MNPEYTNSSPCKEKLKVQILKKKYIPVNHSITNSLNSCRINLSTTFTSLNTEGSLKTEKEKSKSPQKVAILSPNMFHRKNVKYEPVIELNDDEEDTPGIPKFKNFKHNFNQILIQKHDSVVYQ